jgi:hypothetical protein
MRPIVRSLAAAFAVAMFLPNSPSTALAASPSPSPSESVEPSVSPQPVAHIALEPSTEVIPFRTWAIRVTGGTASVDVIEVDDSGSAFDVTVVGESATVEMSLTLPAELVLSASCFDYENQVEIGHVEPPQTFAFEVVPDGLYDCRYQTECAAPSTSDVGVAVWAWGAKFDVSRAWPISVDGGRALGSVGLCGSRPISSLRFVPDPDAPDGLFGQFSVDVFRDSASIEITAPASSGGRELVSAECEDQDDEGRLEDVLVPPRQLVFEVVANDFFTCYVRGAAGTVPPTDTRDAATGRSARGVTATVAFLVFAFLSAASFLTRRAVDQKMQRRRFT